LITHNSWKELNFALGIPKEEDKRLYDEFIAGNMTYSEWNAILVEKYIQHKDANRSGIAKILSRYTYTNGAREAVEYLKNKNYILALISGSTDILVEMVAKDLGIKYYKANNKLIFDENDNLQAIHTEDNDLKAKKEHLESLARMLGIDIKECACVADGANDIEMFHATGHGITFKGMKIEKDAWKVIETLPDLKNIF
ncbi:HAD-IB family phosphatase, partial [Candidatus Nomurabacteria bacterium]|nr:HAD-IB family phosphatase [Candidatus Nomurabacteria bacterium]